MTRPDGTRPDGTRPDGTRPDGTRVRRPTATSQFGVGRRESHDASDFYARFAAPQISRDDEVCPAAERTGFDQVVHGDIRAHAGLVAPRSVALVVTSPPYYSGKEYETAIGEGHVPASYADYLEMLTGVLGACADTLEPGGRMAVNVANLGRKPYRSLSADVIGILEEDLGLLLRGEIVWRKARGATGSCAWGTYQRPGDPVLRDVTERVIVASKGRFDRAIPPSVRAQRGLPSEATIFRDEFMEATTDLWELPSERATRVGHPAPFPVELPHRLIDLYTYRGDLVLDPFMGSGSTALAALRTERHYVGFDTDEHYVAASIERIEEERARLAKARGHTNGPDRPLLPASPQAPDPDEDYVARAVREGRRARELAKIAIEEAGFRVSAQSKRLRSGVEVTFVANDAAGTEWLFDVSGAFGVARSGLQCSDTLWKVLGKATVVQHTRPGTRYVLLTTAKPPAKSAGGHALAALTRNPSILCAPGHSPGASDLFVAPDVPAKPVYDVVDIRDPADLARLRGHADAHADAAAR